jgi:hypothetical protein
MPVVPPVAPAPTDEPLLVPLAAVPPAAEPPPAEPPLLCASANVLDSANAVAKAIVVNFMGWFLVDDCHDNSPPRSSVPTPSREMSCPWAGLSGSGNPLPQPGTERRCDDDRGHDVGRGGFYDRSKPATRRWCMSMLCGNRKPDPSRGRLIVAIDVNRAVVQSLAR